MKTGLFIPLLGALLLPLGLLAQGRSASTEPLRVNLPAGTPLVLTAPDIHPTDARFFVYVAESVVVDSQTLIAAGTPVPATIQAVDSTNTDPTVWFTIEYVEATDGRLVFVNPRSFPLRTPGGRWTTRVKNNVTIIAVKPNPAVAQMR